MAKAAKKTTPATKRFSAKLLFQYRSEGDKENIRMCEERIITFNARSPRNALQIARSNGRKAQFDAPLSFYKNVLGIFPFDKNQAEGRVLFEFVGVLDLLDLTSLCQPNEVWYHTGRHRVPIERLIPSDEQLLENT